MKGTRTNITPRPEPEQHPDGWPSGYPGARDFGLGPPGMNLVYKPALWAPADLLKLANCRALNGEEDSWRATGLCRHVRLLQAGDLFVARASTSDEDDHYLVREAWAQGAVAAIVSRKPEGLPADWPLFLVPDTEAAIAQLGQMARLRTQAKVVGITGSVGKTASKEALHLILSRQAPTVATWHNDNSVKGVPLALAQIPTKCDFAVLEVGMNQSAARFLQICREVRPQLALITAITPEHLDQHGSLDAIAANKSGLITALEPGGFAVLPRDCAQFSRLKQAVDEAPAQPQLITFGHHPESDLRVTDVRSSALASEVQAVWQGRHFNYRLNVVGDHWVSISLGALAAALALDMSLEMSAAALADLRPGFRRGQLLRAETESGSLLILDDSFSASPTSMEAACRTFARMNNPLGGRKIMVLGTMWGLGEASDHYHRALAASVCEAAPDLVFTAGTHAVPLFEALPSNLRGRHFETVEMLAQHLPNHLANGDFILLKASLRLDFWKVAAQLLPWAERRHHIVSSRRLVTGL